MSRVRPLRTLGACLAAIGGIVIALYAGQDLWHYWQAISAGYTEWATSSQGLWQLTCGVAESVAAAFLFFLSARSLGTGPILWRGRHAPRAAEA